VASQEGLSYVSKQVSINKYSKIYRSGLVIHNYYQSWHILFAWLNETAYRKAATIVLIAERLLSGILALGNTLSTEKEKVRARTLQILSLIDLDYITLYRKSIVSG
jgi:hypothetical protein